MKNSKITIAAPTKPTGWPIQEPKMTTVSNRIDISYEGQHVGIPGQKIAEEGEEKGVHETRRRRIIQTILAELSVADKIDLMAFVVFNAGYVVFNIFYFLRC